MKYTALLLLFLTASLAANAQMYKCTIGGQVSYQAMPCPAKSRTQVMKSTPVVKKPTGLCESGAELAETIMRKRQQGVDIIQLEQAVSSSGSLAVDNLSKAMVRTAYGRPQFSTFENQQRAIQDFKNESYLACTKTGSPR